jgi:hypothetical protein
MQAKPLEPNFKEGEAALRSRFYRSNYAVFLPHIIAQLSETDLAKFNHLRSKYAEKFPIAATHRYVTEEVEDSSIYGEDRCTIAGTQTDANIVFPASLLYSMPQEWQLRLEYICEKLTAIYFDEADYQVNLLHPTPVTLDHVVKDHYGYRNEYHNGDSEFDCYR